MEAVIRDFRDEDLPTLQAIRTAAFSAVFAGFREALGPRIADVVLSGAEAEQSKLLAELCANDADRVLVVAAVAAPLGFVGLRCDQASAVGEIVLMAVSPEVQGRGLGHRLVEAALEAMRAEGMRAAVVGAGGDSAHAAARETYRRAGFTAAIPSVHLYRAL